MSKNVNFSLDEVKYGFTGITTFMRSELMRMDDLKEKDPTIVVMEFHLMKEHQLCQVLVLVQDL